MSTFYFKENSIGLFETRPKLQNPLKLKEGDQMGHQVETSRETFVFCSAALHRGSTVWCPEESSKTGRGAPSRQNGA